MRTQLSLLLAMSIGCSVAQDLPPLGLPINGRVSQGDAKLEGCEVTIYKGNDVVGHQIRLDSVRIGEAQVYDVSAIVLPQSMAFVLLGNSFLTRFQMQRTNDQLTLDRRY